jgi:hypothetical protein
MKKMLPQITRTPQEISDLLKGTRLEPSDPQRDFEENSEGWTADKAVSLEELRNWRNCAK